MTLEKVDLMKTSFSEIININKLESRIWCFLYCSAAEVGILPILFGLRVSQQQTGNRRTEVWQLQQLLKQNLGCGRSPRRPLWRTFVWQNWSYSLWQESKAWLRLSSARRDADPDYGYSQVLEKTLNLINTMVEAELDNSRVYVPYSWKRFMRWSGCSSKDRSLAASGCINSHLCVITASLSWRGSWARSCGFQFYIRSMLLCELCVQNEFPLEFGWA